MKIKSLEMYNFSRYKGRCKINFSTDNEKNVTLILGRNTSGKTTIAQAFRWCLYDELIATQHDTDVNKMMLLNKEVIASMKIDETSYFYVEVILEEGNIQWAFRRQKMYKKVLSGAANNSVRGINSTLTMVRFVDGVPGDVISDDGKNSDRKRYPSGCVTAEIQKLLPKSLSRHIFFDGEHWGDDARYTKSAIKTAIESLLGITGYLELKKHLKDNTRCNVISKLKDSRSGSSEDVEPLRQEIATHISNIAALEGQAAEIAENLEKSEAQVSDWEAKIRQNSKAAQDQDDLAKLEGKIKRYTEEKSEFYADFINTLSKSAAKFLTLPLIPQLAELLESVDLEGSNIPDITTKTVDYLIEHGVCLCGTPLVKGSPEYNSLLKLRNVVPPEKIGGHVSQFQHDLEAWDREAGTLVDDLEATASRFNDKDDDLDVAEREKAALIAVMGRKVNIKAIHEGYRQAKNDRDKYMRDQAAKQQEITTEKALLEKAEQSLESLTSKLDANKEINLAIEYAEALYKLASEKAEKETKGIFDDLNRLIEANFAKIFSDKEKYARLDPTDYRVHVYYKATGEEENSLSGAEKPAANFAYILSVLELTRIRDKQQKESGEDDLNDIIQLPLVLDAPFSNFDGTNTNLLSAKIPQLVGQVILMQFEKDWQYGCELEKYVPDDAYYYIQHDDDSMNSSIVLKGGVTTNGIEQ